MEELKGQNSLLLQLVKSLQSQINSKNRQNQALFQQYQQLVAQNQAIQQQLNEQRHHLLEMKRQLQSRRQSQPINSLQTDPRVEKQLARFRQRQAETMAKYQQLRAQFQEKCRLVVDLQSKLEQTMKHSDKLTKQKNSLSEQVQHLLNQIKLHEETRNQLHTLLIQQNNRVSQLQPFQHLIEEMGSALALKSDELASSQGRLATKENQLSDLAEIVNHQAEGLKTKNEEIATLQQRLKIQNSGEWENLKQNIKELEEIIANKQSTISEFSHFMADQAQLIIEMEERLGKSQSMHQQKHNQSQKILELESVLRDKEQSLSKLTVYLQEQIVLIRSMEAQKQKLQSQLIVFRQRLQTNQQQLKDVVEFQYEAKQTELNKQLQDKRQMISEIDKLLDQKAHEMENIQIQISQKQQKATQLQLQTNKIKEQLEITVSQMKERINLAHSQYSQQIERNQQLKQQNEKIEDLVKSKQTAIAQLQQTVEFHQKQIQQLKISQSHYQTQLKYYQQKTKANTTDSAKFKENEEYKVVQADNNNQDQQQNKIGLLMDVMESLHQQIRSKDIIIEKMQQQIQNLKDKGHDFERQPIIMEAQVQFKLYQQQKQAQIGSIKQRYLYIQEQLQIYKQQCAELEEKIKSNNQFSPKIISQHQLLNRQELQKNNYNCMEDCLRLQELNLSQILQKLLFYSKRNNNLQVITFLIQRIKQLQVEKMVELQTQIDQYKQKFANSMLANHRLQDELQKVSRETKENAGIIQQKDIIIHELSKQLSEIEERFGLEVKELRTSMGCFEESPIDLGQLIITATNRNAVKDEKLEELIKELKSEIKILKQNGIMREEELQKFKLTSSVIAQLKQQIQTLKKENMLKTEELRKQKENIANQFDDILRKSGINRKDDKQQIQLLSRQLEQVRNKCRSYQQKIQQFSRQKRQLAQSQQHLNDTPKQQQANKEQENAAGLNEQNGQDFSHQQAQLGSNMHSHNQDPSYNNTISQQPSQYQQQQLLITEKNQIIAELQKTIVNMENGYNKQILSLRCNIAELNNEIITLRKTIYQTNANINVPEFIKETFPQNKDGNSFKHELPSKRVPERFTLPPRKNQNQSYYTESGKSGRAVRMPYQPYYNEELTLGQKMMGRKCRGPYLNASSLSNSVHMPDRSGWSRIYQ